MGSVVTVVSMLRRVWIVLLIGCFFTALAVVVIGKHPGVYWSRVDLIFLRPTGDSANPLAATPLGTIRMASIIQREMSGGPSETDAVSDAVNLVSQGVTDGWSVRLPNDGNQYANNFNKAYLDVQVAGPTEAVVRQRMNDLLGRISGVLATRQAGVAADSQVRLSQSPTQVQVLFDRGAPKRALAATLLLGLGITIGLCVLYDTHVRRGRRRHRARRPAPEPQRSADIRVTAT
jgi:hypothetical protein